jgi:hypothetical protein
MRIMEGLIFIRQLAKKDFCEYSTRQENCPAMSAGQFVTSSYKRYGSEYDLDHEQQMNDAPRDDLWDPRFFPRPCLIAFQKIHPPLTHFPTELPG